MCCFFSLKKEGTPFPTELKYAYLEEGDQCPMVISSSLTISHEDNFLGILRKCKQAIGWQISYLKGINPLVCTHHIYMEEESKPVQQPKRRLNPHMQEVVRTEVLKFLHADIIYPISDSPWVSPTQVVPVATPEPGPTRLAGLNRNPGDARLILFLFIFLLNFLF